MRVLVVPAILVLAIFCRLSAQEKIRIVNVLDLQRTSVYGFAFCNESQKLFVSYTDASPGEYDDRLYQWDIQNKKLEHVYRLGSDFVVGGLTLSPDDRLLVVSCGSNKPVTGKTVLLDVQRHQFFDDFQIDRSSLACFSMDGSRFAIFSSFHPRDSQFPVFDTTGRQVQNSNLAEFQPPKNPYVWYRRAVSKGDPNHGMYCKDAAGKEIKLDVEPWAYNFGATTDGRYIAATTWDGDLIVWRRADVKEVFRRRMAQQYGHLQYDSKQNRFLWADATRGTSKLRALLIESPN